MRTPAMCACIVALLLLPGGPGRCIAAARYPVPILVADAAAGAAAADDADGRWNQQPSPEERMARRFPQPVRVGFLIGLPLLDWDDNTIGFIRNVVRTREGKIELIVGVGGWFGYWAKRLVAVPLETVAILARQVDALDLSWEQIEASPTWDRSQGQPIDPDDMIMIAVARR